MHLYTSRILLWVTTAVLAGGSLVAQGVPAAGAAPAHGSETSIFAPLTLPPAPSATRLATGAPGPKYWQNRTDYDLHATLDTATQTVRGSMLLRYTNHSPDTLKVFWFQTEQQEEVIDQFTQLVQGQPIVLAQAHPDGDIFELRVTPAVPLPPGQTTTFQVQWHFHVPQGGDLPDGLRMGRNGTLYELGQWYPRPNVYDDVTGWNTESYATNAEFYLEYGDFRLALTVPAGYIVAATGTLDNPAEVLTATERARLALAAHADTVVRIVTAAELQSGTARPTRAGMLTWKFHAMNVRDAAWATAPDYQWDATQWHHTLVQAYYRPATAAVWVDAADQTRMSIQEYSERWFPYPYPQVTSVEGPAPGMEYPMFAMNGVAETQHGLYTTLTHEVGHNWFPMIVGSNERMYGWMDEGFNEFIDSFSEARRYPERASQEARIVHQVYGGTGGPIVGGSYEGTAYVLQLLRRDVLGQDVFDKAFRTYIRRWAYKHPTPQDFFRTMENVSGRDLAWFWRECFLEAPPFDQAIDSVTQTAQGSDTHVTVTYGNTGRAVFPLLVRFTFSDGTTKNVTYPADDWKAHPASYTVSYTFHNKTVRRIALDPERHLPDANETNNSWTAP